tara:strand:- start:552 stop:1304 length:753 start_codon:yes stop_codon:yes gene_type:complete
MLRIIPRLDIKGDNLVKTIYLEGLRKIGPPNKYAIKYYKDSADELLFMDLVATLYGRNNLHKIIYEASKNIFIPLTVGGGIRSIDDAIKCLKSGADKIAVNTAAIENPNLIKDLAERLGSSTVVLSVEAKKISNDWYAFTRSGRENSGRKINDWIKQASFLGVGEICITSVDNEGTFKGIDTELLKKISKLNIKQPIVLSGGIGSHDDIIEINRSINLSGICIAGLFHYEKSSIKKIKKSLMEKNLNIRY